MCWGDEICVDERCVGVMRSVLMRDVLRVMRSVLISDVLG